MFLLNKLRHNMPAKIISLVVAVGLWFAVMREQNPVMEAAYTVPVSVQNMSSQYIVENLPQEVTVTLRGPRNSILALNRDTLKAYVNLAGAQPGESSVNILFSSPSGMSVQSIDPDRADVIVDEYAVREMPVEVHITGIPKKGYSVKGTDAVPKVVSVSGPKRTVEDVHHAVVSVNVEGRDETYGTTEEVQLIGSSSGYSSLGVTPYQGQVTVTLVKTEGTKRLPVKPNVTGTPAAGTVLGTVTSEPGVVEVSGTELALESLTSVSTATISVAGASETVEGIYALNLPAGISSSVTEVSVKAEIASPTDSEAAGSAPNPETGR